MTPRIVGHRICALHCATSAPPWFHLPNTANISIKRRGGIHAFLLFPTVHEGSSSSSSLSPFHPLPPRLSPPHPTRADYSSCKIPLQQLARLAFTWFRRVPSFLSMFFFFFFVSMQILGIASRSPKISFPLLLYLVFSGFFFFFDIKELFFFLYLGSDELWYFVPTNWFR